MIAVEKPFSIYVNGKHIFSTMITPGKKKAFVFGHIMAEGLIEKIDEIIKVSMNRSRADVRLIKVRTERIRFSSSASMDSMMMVEAKEIARIANELSGKGKVYQATHGTHFAALVKIDGEIVSFVEDVGRHNAIDKALGEGLMKKVDFSTCILFASCRQQRSTISKASKLGVVIVVSLVAPLQSGIDSAKGMRVTLVCVKRQYLSVYTHPSRIRTNF